MKNSRKRMMRRHQHEKEANENQNAPSHAASGVAPGAASAPNGAASQPAKGSEIK